MKEILSRLSQHLGFLQTGSEARAPIWKAEAPIWAIRVPPAAAMPSQQRAMP